MKKLPTTLQVGQAYVNETTGRDCPDPAEALELFKAWLKMQQAVFLLEIAAGIETSDAPRGSLQWYADQEFARRLRVLGDRMLKEALR